MCIVLNSLIHVYTEVLIIVWCYCFSSVQLSLLTHSKLSTRHGKL